MINLDKKMKEISKDLRLPKEYEERVEETLKSVPEERKSSKLFPVKGLVALLCLCLAGYFLFANSQEVKANFLQTFTQTILDFFDIGEKESQSIGVETKKENSVSKPELMMELKEKMIDSHNIYLVVKVTASSGIDLASDVSFDYFAFCKGSNYNEANLISGAKDCKLLEMLEGKSNVATYIVSLSSDEEIEDGEETTIFFKDLMRDPFGENPEMLVEGMWSINFTTDHTVSEEMELEGEGETVYPFINTTATLKKIKLTPLGLTVVSDVSNVPYEDLGISDTTIAVRLKMIDGSESVVRSHDMEESTIVSSGSSSYEQKKKKTFMTDTYQFKKAINTGMVLGIYLEDVYIPMRQ